MTETNIKETVKEKYGQAALRVHSGGSSCCGASPSSGCADAITSNVYDVIQTNAIPQEAVLASLGCGNPTALAQLNPGETVLDLGSGGGIDVLLSAKRVGPTGKAYGDVMTVAPILQVGVMGPSQMSVAVGPKLTRAVDLLGSVATEMFGEQATTGGALAS